MTRARWVLAACIGTAAMSTHGAALDTVAFAETHRLATAPYYVGLGDPQPAPGSCAVFLPVSLDPQLLQQFGYEGRAREFEPIVRALDARIAGVQASCVRVAQGPAPPGRPPRVYVGSSESEYAPPEGGQQRLPGDRFAPMILHLERPDAAWRDAVANLIQAHDVDHAVQVQVGVSQYAKGRATVFGKEVVLGTGHRQAIKFMTAEDKPVEVLQLTGVLVDASGRPLRAGAEGIVLRDTPFLAQAIDAHRTFDSAEIERVLDLARRADLPGAPLKLDVALDNLLAQLTRGAVPVPVH